MFSFRFLNYCNVRRSNKFRFDWFLSSRTANELHHRAKILLSAIQREYDENKNKNKNVDPFLANDLQQSSTSNKENERKSDKNNKRKCWMPTITFASDQDKHKTKKKVKFAELAVNGPSLGTVASSQPSTSYAVASTSQSSSNPFTNGQKALDMPMIE